MKGLTQQIELSFLWMAYNAILPNQKPVQPTP
ncbi:hypothetical protein PTD2_21042 [Pseudoalteromonas tunicata D2]|jgi:hypothetical protein|uniref:Uncharacterized protein n=1 Tax=Pseudoalteromonas tunicata D2 TaxID=87626 RepID=A4CAD4_9GAMM|nr:hypothetical protein PTD2_21042 [Pseudoalteromonas tunicata D2]